MTRGYIFFAFVLAAALAAGAVQFGAAASFTTAGAISASIILCFAGRAIWQTHLLLISAARGLKELYVAMRGSQQSRPKKRAERHEDLSRVTGHSIAVQLAPAARYAQTDRFESNSINAPARWADSEAADYSDSPYPVLRATANGGWVREARRPASLIQVTSVVEDAPTVHFKEEGMVVLQQNEADRKKGSRRKSTTRLNAILLADLLESSVEAVKARIIAELDQCAAEGKESPTIVPAIAQLAGVPTTIEGLRQARRHYQRSGRVFDHCHTGYRTFTIWIASKTFGHPGRALSISVTRDEEAIVLTGRTALEYIEAIE